MEKPEPLNLIEIFGRVTYEMARALRVGLGETPLPAWDDAPAVYRDAAFAGVELYMQNDNLPASAKHDMWLKAQIEKGWVYGPEVDQAKKISPFIVPFEELSEAHQLKDYMFKGVLVGVKRWEKDTMKLQKKKLVSLTDAIGEQDT